MSAVKGFNSELATDYTACVEALLAAGADSTIKDKVGNLVSDKEFSSNRVQEGHTPYSASPWFSSMSRKLLIPRNHH